MLIKELLTTRQTSKANSERASILELILNEVNKERETVSGYYSDKKKKWVHLKKVSAKVLAVKLSHIKTGELRDFYSTCLRYSKEKGSFNKCMFGAIKPK